MQEKLVEVIQESVNETIISFFQHDNGIEPGPSVVKKTGEPYQPPRADVTSIIAFSGGMEGGVHLSAPMHAAVGIARAFSGETITEFDDICIDAIGEIANIIAGSIRSHMPVTVNLTPPSIVIGKNHDVKYMDQLESTRCYFKSHDGPFLVEVFYKNIVNKLIDALKEEHKEINGSLVEVILAGIGTREGQRLFWLIEKTLTSHIQKEDTLVYSVLEDHADERIKKILLDFNRDMANVHEHLKEFSEKILRGEPTVDLERGMEFVGNLIKSRINLEEEIIFKEYAQICDAIAGESSGKPNDGVEKKL